MVTICEHCARQTNEDATYKRATVHIDDTHDIDPLPIQPRTDDRSGSSTAPPQTKSEDPQKTGQPIKKIEMDDDDL